VAQALRHDQPPCHLSNIPIIMLTAKNDRSARLAALNAGVEEFLTKPFDAAELQLRVRNLLRLKEYGDFLQNHSRTLEQQVQARTAALTAEIAERKRAEEALRGYATAVSSTISNRRSVSTRRWRPRVSKPRSKRTCCVCSVATKCRAFSSANRCRARSLRPDFWPRLPADDES